jgi:hypothetical protein
MHCRNKIILYYCGVYFRQRCWFLGLFVYFIVNFVLIFADVKVYCVNWNLFEIIPSYPH